MELIILIAIISYVVKAVKKANEEQTSQFQQAARENIAKAKQRAQARAGEVYEQMNLSEYTPKQEQRQNRTTNEHFQQANEHRQQENRVAMQQVHAARMEAKNTTILQRAKANADEDKVDVTLETMEAEHNHSERVSAAVHHHPEDVIPENMLGSVEDLMVKGYDGNLCFERDFVGEGLDMISRFSYQ